MPRFYAPVFLAALVFAGCSGPSVEVTPLAPETSELGGAIPITTGDIDAPHEEIAILTVGSFDTTRELIAALRDAAREAGADAVIRVSFEAYGGGESGNLRRVATGTAVRYR